MRIMPTPTSGKINYDVREAINKNIFKGYELGFGMGDGVVDTISQYAGPLKWAQDFIDQKENSYPVKLIDVCNRFKEKYSIWDNVDSGKDYKVLKNEFFGISCDCMSEESPEKCSHTMMPTDTRVIKAF